MEILNLDSVMSLNNVTESVSDVSSGTGGIFSKAGDFVSDNLFEIGCGVGVAAALYISYRAYTHFKGAREVLESIPATPSTPTPTK